MIHHVLLACPAGSEAASRAFYSGVLGMDEIEKPPALAPKGGCWFRGHGFELHLGRCDHRLWSPEPSATPLFAHDDHITIKPRILGERRAFVSRLAYC